MHGYVSARGSHLEVLDAGINKNRYYSVDNKAQRSESR